MRICQGTLVKSILQCPEKGFGMAVLQAILSQIECLQVILNKNEEHPQVQLTKLGR